MENTPFGGFSTGWRKSVSGCGGIMVFSGMVAICAELEFAGLLKRQSFAAKGQAMPHANLADLRLSVAAE
jgi:hypothetical protein